MAKQMAPGIAVLTSGGDAPGMNAAVRAIVRSGIARGARVHIIEDGFAGLADRSGSRIKPVSEWRRSGGILHQGGAIIGSVRYPEFKLDEMKRNAIGDAKYLRPAEQWWLDHRNLLGMLGHLPVY